MKRKLNIFSLLLAAGLSYAQTGGLSTGENYVYTKNCLNEDCSRKTEAVEYSDGLGRSKQVIGIKSSPNGKDVVTPLEYDAFGRQVRSYLPIPQTGTQNGALYADPKAVAAQTYGSDPYFYSESVMESAPSAKILSGTKPGADYHGYSVNYGYEMNAAGEVKKYSIATAWQNGATGHTLTAAGNYNAGELVKTSVTDEDGHKTTEFKNGKGQTLLVRKENADTYYVYNKYGHLAYVIPPLAASQALSATLLNDFCYQYRYDSRGRQVEKKLPGKGWEYTVYDRQDRVLMTQDANMGASKQWLFTKYDKLGRAVYTGIFTSAQRYGSEGRQAEQVEANSAAAPQNESRDTAGFSAGSVTAYYTNAVYPTAFTKILSIHYFDTYPSGSPARPSQIFSKATIGDNMADAVNTKNLPTASYIKNIEDDNWTKSYIWYNEKTRSVGTYTVNYLGGFTQTESALDFAGVVQQSRITHARLASDTPKVITQTFEYDVQNRLKKQWHQVDSRPQELLSENMYNDLSQLTGKKIGNNLQDISYSYNIRGSVTKINDPATLGTDLFAYSLDYYTPASSAAGKYSGNVALNSWKTSQDQVLRSYSYQYDNLNRLTKGIYAEPGTSVPQNDFYGETATYDLNGNITALQRSGKNALGAKSLIDNLNYSYAGTNRLTGVTDDSGDYAGYPDTSGIVINYDDNGNMKDHMDKGILQIDYNILNLPVYIKFNQTVGRIAKRFVNTTYLYRADGVKLNKIHSYKASPTAASLSWTRTDYMDGFQYETLSGGTAAVLKFVPTSEGYYDFEKNKYIYSYTDHLGNVRLSYFKNSNGSAEVLEENNYYPFGLKHQGYNENAGNPSYTYQYNGKELQKETGWSDYGARMYMSDIGRWGVIDPLAETSRRFTPYNYAYDNPVSFIDPDGRKAMAANDLGLPIATGGALENIMGGRAWQFGGIDEFAELKKYAAEQEKNSGGGSGPGPKSSTGPGIIRQFINWLFGKKSSKTLTVGTAEGSFDRGTRLFGLIRNANLNANGESALEQYRNWRDNPSYNAGESWLDRFARNVNSSHMEILQDEGSGGGLMWGGYGRMSNVAGAAEVVEEAVPNGNFYSVAFETVLSDDMYPGVSSYMHFKSANAALETGMSAEVMSELGIVIPRSSAGSILGKSPTNWVWHHDIGEGVMQLVPKSQHPNVPGGIFWNTLHPTGKGGMSIWGGGYK